MVRDEETIKGIINCSSESSDNPQAKLEDTDKTLIMAAFLRRKTRDDYLTMRIPDLFLKHCLNRTEELYPRRYQKSLQMAIGVAKNSHWYMEVLYGGVV